MSENIIEKSEEIIVGTPETTPAPEKLSINYCLEQIERISKQTEYLNQTIEQLGCMADGDNAEACSPGNTLGAAKAQALADVVRCRETTNQKLIAFYEKVYDDLKPRTSSSREEVAARLTEALLDPTVDLIDKDRISIILQRYMQTL